MMSTSQKSTLNQILNHSHLVLATALFLTVPVISNADDSMSSGNNLASDSNAQTSKMPAPEAQEMRVEESPDSKLSAEQSSGKVARAIFTSEIVDREPANDLTTMDNTSGRIYFYTDLRNLAGQIVTHRWEYNDTVMAEVKFKVGDGPRWRVYSSKNLLPEWTGSWTVFVTDENERTLNTSVFNYTQAETDVAPINTTNN